MNGLKFSIRNFDLKLVGFSWIDPMDYAVDCMITMNDKQKCPKETILRVCHSYFTIFNI